jgi:hypothetical protein
VYVYSFIYNYIIFNLLFILYKYAYSCAFKSIVLRLVVGSFVCEREERRKFLKVLDERNFNNLFFLIIVMIIVIYITFSTVVNSIL